ncbi:hypothetical protein PARMER_04179 [Parabacteroides merdae ATCC 43184]|nr:hypothetical protein PARMER_04179 [Parabacteroides merdae ATCC 43184]
MQTQKDICNGITNYYTNYYLVRLQMANTSRKLYV